MTIFQTFSEPKDMGKKGKGKGGKKGGKGGGGKKQHSERYDFINARISKLHSFV